MKTKTIGYTWNKVKLSWNNAEQIWTMSAHDFAAMVGDAMAETIDYDGLNTGTFTNDDLSNVIKFLLGQYFDIEVE